MDSKSATPKPSPTAKLVDTIRANIKAEVERRRFSDYYKRLLGLRTSRS